MLKLRMPEATVGDGFGHVEAAQLFLKWVKDKSAPKDPLWQVIVDNNGWNTTIEHKVS
jgi:hypothetical protein